MRKRKKILLILIIFLAFANIVYANSTILVSEDNRIVAYKEVNAVRLTLSDGQVMSYSSLDKHISQEITENIDPVEIIFVLDCSGSMTSHSRITQLKEATTALITKLYELLPADKLTIGLIPFNSQVISDQVLDLTNQLPVITQRINSLQASGGTRISGAIDLATSKFTPNSTSKKIIITVTDGSVSDASDTTNSLSTVISQGIAINSIFFDLAPQTCFTSVVPTENIFEINTSSGNTIYETMVNTLYDSIYSELVEIVENTSTSNSYNAALLPNELILITLDDELMHGAILEIEYIFTIQLQTDCTSIYIQDYLTPELIYAEDAKLLTENQTNASYHWQFNGQTLTYSSISPNNMKKGSTITQKVVVSTTLTPKNSNNRFENNAYFQIVRADGENFTGESNALSVLVLPPFGKETSILSSTVSLLPIGMILLQFLSKRKK